MNRFVAAALVLLTMGGCKPDNDTVNPVKTGIWRAAIEIQGQELPFNFEVTRDRKAGYDVYIINGEERLLLDEVSITEDSVDIGLHIFDANIRAKVSGDSMQGVFVKNFAKDYILPFQAAWGQEYRFPRKNEADSAANFEGKYDVTFFSGDDKRRAIGIFHQTDDLVTGTFLTATGDYRYLSGNADGKTLRLSAFDGDNLYLFHAILQDDGKIQGDFFSGKTRRETWVAEKNDDATAPKSESLTYLKEGYDRISFSLPDVNGKTVSLEDDTYRGKVVILQLLGTWCPNCMDETRFLAPWYDKNKDRGVEVIGLAYETKDDFSYASARVKKMMEKIGVHYKVVIAGTNDKESRGASLPMLNAVVAFPTTIFIGKDGKVKMIHTGFSGPGTGEYFERFKEDFNTTVNSLLNEDLTAKR